MSSYEVVYGFKHPEFVRFATNPSIPEHMIKSFEDYDILRKEVKAATLHLIETDDYTTQDLRWFQQMKS